MNMESSSGLGSQEGYTQVATQTKDQLDIEAIQPNSTGLRQKINRLVNLTEPITKKAMPFLWIYLTGLFAYQTNFFRVICSQPEVHDLFLNISLMCIGIIVCLGTYESVFLPYVFRVEGGLETYYPNGTYIRTFCGVLGFLTMLIAIWPVWGFYSLFLLLVMLIAYFQSAQILPKNKLGSTIFAHMFLLLVLIPKFTN